jgi:hypothetical protein
LTPLYGVKGRITVDGLVHDRPVLDLGGLGHGHLDGPRGGIAGVGRNVEAAAVRGLAGRALHPASLPRPVVGPQIVAVVPLALERTEVGRARVRAVRLELGQAGAP